MGDSMTYNPELATKKFVEFKTGRSGTTTFKGTKVSRVIIPKDIFADTPKILISEGRVKNLTKETDGSWRFDLILDSASDNQVDWQALPRKGKGNN